MAHSKRNQTQQKQQVPPDMPESNHRNFRNKNLLQNKKDRESGEELDHQSGFGMDRQKHGKKS